MTDADRRDTKRTRIGARDVGFPAIALAVLSASLCVGCPGAEPEIVWVPDAGFSATLAIDAELPEDRTVTVGEELVLHAVRSTGPWQQVSRAGLDPDACWLVRPPDPVEHEVQARVRWIAEPAGSAVFNLPQVQDLKLRTVTFHSPGTYSLRARADAWCGPPVDSESIEIVVVAAEDVP